MSIKIRNSKDVLKWFTIQQLLFLSLVLFIDNLILKIIFSIPHLISSFLWVMIYKKYRIDEKT